LQSSNSLDSAAHPLDENGQRTAGRPRTRVRNTANRTSVV
jgi:hypothetical protein